MGCEVDSPVDFDCIESGISAVRSNSAHISYMNLDLPHFLITAHSTSTITLQYTVASNSPHHLTIIPRKTTLYQNCKLRLNIEAELCFLSTEIASLQTLP